MKKYMLLFLVLLCSCVTGLKYEVVDKYDPYEKKKLLYEKDNCYYRTIVTSGHNAAITTKGYCMNLVLINDSLLYLNVKYSAPDWLFIPKGNSLKFLIDGEVMSLYAPFPSERKVDDNANIDESILYPITKEKILKLINGNKISFKLHTEEFILDQDILNNWGGFYNTYLENRKLH